MRFILGIVLVAVLLGVAWKTTGHDLPILDYRVGPLGGEVVQPDIEIHPPGYNLNVP